MNYNTNIHHRRSIRLKGYDYSRAGAYYITMCCQDRACLFGKISHGEMILNEYGTIAYNEWLNTPKIRENVELDVFVIMPNHIHGIIVLTGRGETHSNVDVPTDTGRGELHSPGKTTSNDGRGELHSPHDIPSDNMNMCEWHSPDNEPNDNIGRGECDSPLRGPSNTIGAIVRGFKSSVTKQLNLLNIGCVVWQRNYYEHIIRNEQQYQRISDYIIDNPAKWKDDKFNNAYIR